MAAWRAWLVVVGGGWWVEWIGRWDRAPGPTTTIIMWDLDDIIRNACRFRFISSDARYV